MSKKETKLAEPKRKPAKGIPRRRTRMIALEPRMLFDGALGVDLSAKATQAMMGDTAAAEVAETAPAATEPAKDAARPVQETQKPSSDREVLDAAKTPEQRLEVVFVDGSVEGYETLLADVNPNAKVVVLDPTKDGVQQISDYLRGMSGVDAVHIVSHGAEGVLELGSSRLTTDTMRGVYAEQLAEIGRHLSADADILVYGCDFAKGDVGSEAAELLAEITGADVAASEDVTGAAEHGGDTEFEKKVGTLETEAVLAEKHFAHWGGTLALTVTNGTGVSDAEMANAISEPGSSGVNVTNATRTYTSAENGSTRTSAAAGIGVFGGLQTNGNLLLESGIVIATGNVTGLVADNQSGNSVSTDLGSNADHDDPDLRSYAIANGFNFGQNDVSVFQMSFTSNVRKLAVEYVFGTDETYTYAVNQNYNDLFGIFLRDHATGTTSTVAAHSLRTEFTGGGFTTNTDTAASGNVESNSVTGVRTALVDLDDFSGTGGSYTVKFAIADQSDQQLDSAAFIGYFGASLQIDLDADNSSGATHGGFSTAFNAATGAPVAIVDSDLLIRNHDSSTDIQTITVTIANAKNGDVLTIPGGLSNISVISNTGTQLVLQWTGGPGDNDVADVKAALQAIRFSNTLGVGADLTDRAITIVLNDGETDSAVVTTTVDMAVSAEAPLVDLNSTPTVSVTVDPPVTTNLVQNGTMNGSTGGVPTGWSEGANSGDGAVSNNGRYVWTGDANASPGAPLTQAITLPENSSSTTYSVVDGVLTETTVVTTNTITELSFDFNWANTDTSGGANNNYLEVRYDGVLYARFQTGGGSNTTGSWTFFNASNSSPKTNIASVGSGNNAARDGALTRVTIRFDTPITTSGTLSFAFMNGPSGAGTDDIAIDNVVLTNTATTTRTTTTVDLVDTGWTTTYTENGAPVRIADTDSSIYGGAGANLTSATIALTNFQAGDRLLVNGSSGNSGTLFGTLNWTRSGANGEIITLSGTATKAQYADAIELITFENTTDNPSTTARVVTVRVNDGVRDSNTAVATINVTPVNDAPVLADTALTMTVTEDAGAPSGAVGSPISAFTGGITDPDGGAKGIAITGTNSANGTWYYSTNGGATWTAVGAVSNTSALLLADNANTRLYFHPNANFNGTVAAGITFRAWDQSSGTAGTKVSTASNGGTTAFSSATDTVSVTVTPVNDAPVADLNGAGGGSNNTVTFTEQTPVAIAPAATLTDVDSASLASLTATLTARPDGNAVESLSLSATAATAASSAGLTVTYNPSTGVLSITGSASTAVYQTVLRGIQYNNTSDNPSIVSRTVDVVVSDGIESSVNRTATISITPVNEAPTDVALSNTVVTENVAAGSVVGTLSTNDPDAGNTFTYALVGGAGDTDNAAFTIVGDELRINASPDFEAKQAYSIRVRATDQDGLSVEKVLTVTVANENEAPTVSLPGALTVVEDITSAVPGITVNDPDGNVTSVQLSVMHGVLDVTLAGSAAVAAGANGTASITITGSQSDINATLATLAYRGAPDYVGPDTLTAVVNDANGANDSRTLPITVVVDGTPVNTVPGAQAVAEDDSLVFASAHGNGISVADANSAALTVTLSVTNGTLSLAGTAGLTFTVGDGSVDATMTFTGSVADINAALAGLTYVPAADYDGPEELSIATSDGTVTTTDTVAITVTPVNDAPGASITVASYAATEQVAVPLAGTLSVADLDSATVTATLAVGEGVLNVTAGTTGAAVSGSGTGAVTITGTLAQVNAVLAGNNGATVSYINGSDAPAASTTLTLTASDGTLSAQDTATIHITPVNDAPAAVIAAAVLNAAEQTALSLAAAGLSVSDPDGDIVSATLTVGEGVLQASAGTTGAVVAGSGTGSVTITGTQAQINAVLAGAGGATLAYYNGSDTPSASTTLTLVASDGTLSATDSATVLIAAVDDAPVAASIPAQTAEGGVPFAFTVPAGTFSDADSPSLTLSATLADGSPLPAWLAFDPATGTFSGTPPLGFEGIALQVTASDGTSVVSSGFRIEPRMPLTVNVPVPSGPASAPASQPGSGAADGSATGLPPAPPSTFPEVPLGQPVDIFVPPSNLNPEFAEAGGPAGVDLNALPPTAAGPSEAIGFPVLRVSRAEAAQRVSDPGSPVGGHRLFVFEGIPTMHLGSDTLGFLRVPESAFAHTDPGAVVHLEARLADGRPLPGWLRFDGLRGTFSGVPPEGVSGSLEIEVVARDGEGREARTRFVLLIEDLSLDERRTSGEVPDVMLGLDVDKKEKEKEKEQQRQKAAKRSASTGGSSGPKDLKTIPPALSFSEQLRAAKQSRDPLLDKLIPKGPDRGEKR